MADKPDNPTQNEPPPDERSTPKPIPPAAQRALEEAEARRRLAANATPASVEKGGPKGAEPTRFGDWERKGIAVDF
jgi:hypothetical protein